MADERYARFRELAGVLDEVIGDPDERTFAANALVGEANRIEAREGRRQVEDPQGQLFNPGQFSVQPRKPAWEGTPIFRARQATRLEDRAAKANNPYYSRMGSTNPEEEREWLQSSEINLAVDSHNVPSIMNEGFKTQLQGSGHSNGMFDPEYRRTFEKSEFGDHPAYGYASPGAVVNNYVADQYGDLHFTLKDDVKDRTSVTTGDSLDADLPAFTWRGVEAGREKMTRSVFSRNPLEEDPADASYTEAQIYGGFTPDDIEYGTFVGDKDGYRGAASVLQERQIPYRKQTKLGRVDQPPLDRGLPSGYRSDSTYAESPIFENPVWRDPSHEISMTEETYHPDYGVRSRSLEDTRQRWRSGGV